MVAGFFNLLVVDATADEEEEYSESGFAGKVCLNLGFLPEYGVGRKIFAGIWV